MGRTVLYNQLDTLYGCEMYDQDVGIVILQSGQDILV